MIKKPSNDKNVNRVLIGIGISMAVFLIGCHFFGEVQGLICVVIALIVQVSFLTGRVVALERELQISHETHESSEASEKTV
jgi:hypothetical protein